METTIKYKIVEEFKRNLKERMNNSDLSFMYLRLFDLLHDKDLEMILTISLDDYHKNKNDWYRELHKSIRQTDFFAGIRVLRANSMLTEEEESVRNVLKGKLDKLYKKYCPNDTMEEFNSMKNQVDYIELIGTLHRLNKKANNEDQISGGGIFDSMLYGLISIDENNELKKIMELTFRICS